MKLTHLTKQTSLISGIIPIACAVFTLVGQPCGNAQNSPPIKDTPFYQDYHEAHPLATPAENDVRALAFDAQERLWAATADGVRYLEAGQWKIPPGAEKLGPTYALCRDGKGVIWIGAWNGLYRATAGSGHARPRSTTCLSARSACCPPSSGQAGNPVRGRAAGHLAQRGAKRQTVDTGFRAHGRRGIRALLPAGNNRLWIGTASGLYLQELTGLPSRLHALFPARRRSQQQHHRADALAGRRVRHRLDRRHRFLSGNPARSLPDKPERNAQPSGAGHCAG